MERLLDEVSFHAARRTGDTIAIDAALRRRAPRGHRRGRQPVAVHPLSGAKVRSRRSHDGLRRRCSSESSASSCRSSASIALGWLYARRVKPDMTWVNRISMNVLAPALIFSALASKDFDVAREPAADRRQHRRRARLRTARVAVRAADARGRADVRAADDVQQLRQHGAAAGCAGVRHRRLLADGRVVHDLQPAAVHARRAGSSTTTRASAACCATRW